jgi:tRNA (cytidine56-2'-O)-methyltransferase
MKIVVLRWGHRLRDERLTTHIALTARALGANGVILSDVLDKDIKNIVQDVVERWGGDFFFKMGIAWSKALKEWKENGGIVVHLTAYGENITSSNVLERIKNSNKDLMILIGSQKIPSDFFSKKVADFNVAIGNQPHSECSALAIFLDRLCEGEELAKNFKDAKIKIIPQKRGKKVIKL